MNGRIAQDRTREIKWTIYKTYILYYIFTFLGINFIVILFPKSAISKILLPNIDYKRS